MPVRLKLPARLFKPHEIKPIMTVHVTDVTGGFGVASYQIAPWRKLLEFGKVTAELLAQLPDPTDLGGSSYLLALLQRYSGDAYHNIASRRAGDVINHPLTLRTSASNGGNMGAAWAVDAGHAEQLSPELIAVGQASLMRSILALHEHTGEVVIVVPHRCWSDQRLGDTGIIAWRAIVLPVVEALGPAVCVVGYNTRGGSGRYISTSWDPAALYDDKGRPVARVAA